MCAIFNASISFAVCLAFAQLRSALLSALLQQMAAPPPPSAVTVRLEIINGRQLMDVGNVFDKQDPYCKAQIVRGTDGKGRKGQIID